MKNKICKPGIILLSFICLTFLTGCWDYTEIEKRGYVLGMAIDLAEAKDLKDQFKDAKPESGIPIYSYTIQIPLIPKSSIKPLGQGGGGGGGASESKTWNLRMAGNSLFEANRELSTILDYPPFYEHLKVIVISEEASREGIYGPLDFLLRDPEMRRRTKVFITPKKAYQALEVTPKIEDYPSMYLRSLPNNYVRNSRIVHRIDLGRISESLHGGNDFILPKIIVGSREIKDAGAAVFKKDKMVGWIDEIQLNYLKWITGYAEGGTLTIDSPDNPNKQVSLEMKSLKTNVKPVINGDEITFNINTKAAFNIAEINYEHNKAAFNKDFIKEIEVIAERKAENEMRKTIESVQNEYGADTFFFYRVMQRYAPDTWDKVKDDWHSIFPKVKVNINVSIKIKEVGLIK